MGLPVWEELKVATGVDAPWVDLRRPPQFRSPHAHRHQHREAARACAAPLVAVLLAEGLGQLANE